MSIDKAMVEVRRMLNWYFLLTSQKRIQVNYLIIIASLITLAYTNDKQHRENYIMLLGRVDAVNNSRSLEQWSYTKKLEYYTDKFNNLLEILLKERKKEIDEDKAKIRNKKR